MSANNTIPEDIAQREHEITTSFAKMNTNDELRFRLNCGKDGSAYIRTETTDKSEGWQNAHYHRGLSETYIVQSGQIVFVEYRNENIHYEDYSEGEVFTTKANIPHNIYMKKESVIHTVKHGKAIKHPDKDADWWDDKKGCTELNDLKKIPIETVSEKISKSQEEAIEFDTNNKRKTIIVLEKDDGLYSPSYVHFDNLIWKFPAWIFGIFTLIFSIFGMMTSIVSSKSLEFKSIKLSINENVVDLSLLLGGFFIIFGLINFSLSYAMYRFRCHQAKQKKKSDKSPLSPQIILQALSSIIVIIILVLGCTFFSSGPTLFLILIVISVILIGLTIWGEFTINNIKYGKEELKMS